MTAQTAQGGLSADNRVGRSEGIEVRDAALKICYASRKQPVREAVIPLMGLAKLACQRLNPLAKR
ncbi:MAG: hypothetical protein EPO13_08345 [Actinomycetota bacterium]|nr:MAG: hypothetical protein EPO13_08345 [Actinomycetota bacterium]